MSILIESLDAGVLTLTINRPEAANTLSTELSGQIIQALQRAKNDAAVRCIVLTGAGSIFSAGGDVKEQASGMGLDDGNDPDAAQAALAKTIFDGTAVNQALYDFPKPTIAVLPGAAAGAGLALALSCDLRFALDTAKLITAFINVGISCDSGLSYFLPRLVGAAKARELCFTSDVISGEEALALGLVTKIASAENFEKEARAYAEKIAALPTVAVGYMKENLNASEHSSLQEIRKLEADNVVLSMGTEDHKRAAEAFVKKERPVFEGR